MRGRLLALVGVAVAIYLHSCCGGHAAKSTPAPVATAARSSRVAVRAERDRVDLVMLRAAMARVRKIDINAGDLRLAGTVVDDRERPITGATVTLNRQRTVTSGDDGSFAFDDLAAGDYQVTADKAPAYGEDSISLVEGADPMKLVMHIGPTLVLRVSDHAGTPVLGAKASTRQHNDAVTDREGKVSFRGMDFGNDAIEVTAPGYATENVHVDLGDDPRRTVEQKVVLQPTAPIGGIVIDQDDKPVPDARVTVSSSAHGFTDLTTTDPQGHWQLLGFGAGKLAISATSDFHIAVSEPLVPFDGVAPKLDLVVHVERGATIGGLVVDAAGNPLDHVHVLAAHNGADTDDHGRFLVTGVEPGPANVEAQTDTLGTPVQNVVVPRAGHLEVRLVMVVSSISGTVTTASGDPVPNAAVSASSAISSTFDHADDTGHFDFKGMAPGEYELTAMRQSESASDVPGIFVKTGAHDVKLVIPDAASIAGRVMMGGQPVDYFGVSITIGNDEVTHSTLDPVRADDGKFTRDELRPGTVTVTVVGPSFIRKEIPNVTIAAGQHVDLGDIEVMAGKSVHGRVVDASGNPIEGAVVVLQASSDIESDISLDEMTVGTRGARTDVAGHFEVSGIPDDETQLAIQASDAEHGIAQARPLTADDFDRDVELVLAATGSLTGTITNNKPGLNYWVHVYAVANETSFMMFSDDDEFTFAQLPTGDYTVQLDSDLVTTPIAFHIDANRTTAITFERPPSLITVQIEIVGGKCGSVGLKAPGAAADSWWIGYAECSDVMHAKIEHVAPGRYEVCDDGCEPIEVAASPELQTFTFTEHAAQDSPPSPSPDPTQSPSPSDPIPDPAGEADPPAAVDEATSTAD
jgi:protocatechuate 3,4-dioxygenase beta subunit